MARKKIKMVKVLGKKIKRQKEIPRNDHLDLPGESRISRKGSIAHRADPKESQGLDQNQKIDLKQNLRRNQKLEIVQDIDLGRGLNQRGSLENIPDQLPEVLRGRGRCAARTPGRRSIERGPSGAARTTTSNTAPDLKRLVLIRIRMSEYGSFYIYLYY